MQPESVPPWIPQLYRELAKPRLPGSPEVAAAEDAIEKQLKQFGLEVERQTFHTSPKRLYAGSILGAGLGWVSLALLPLMVFPVSGWIVTTVGAASFATVALVAIGIANGALPLNTEVVEAHNLIVSRTELPVLWLVAHSDSKTQSISLKMRIFASIVTAASFIAVFAVLVARLFGPVPVPLAVPPLIALIGGAAALSLPPLRGGSPGAVDNASGVIAVLRAVELLKDRPDVGVLVTGAEEYGMEGARAWIANQNRTGHFINFDGIDATGRFNVMVHGEADRLHDVVCEVLGESDFSVRDRALPFGVFVDGAIIAGGGLAGVTISRGTWDTLSVVHTMADTADRTDPGGAAAAGAAAAEAARRFLG